MDYLYCMPDLNNTRENCEKIHNILARMSDKYKLNIVPEPVKAKYFGGLLQEISDLQGDTGNRRQQRRSIPAGG